jgi:NADH:ubiquinone oxidoreductase subunit 6 (subunit J)
VAFYILTGLAIISAAAILFVRSVLDAALCLIICLLSLAGVYVLLNAEFLAIVQILVYAGGILLLIIFGVMITRPTLDHDRKSKAPAFIVALILLALLWNGLRSIPESSTSENNPTAAQLGISLMTQYALPFEIAGLLLLVSLIGAMITSSFRNRA